MRLILEPQHLAVCRLDPSAASPAWTSATVGFLSITRTPDELSVVCAQDSVPSAVKHEPGWRALKVAGPLEFTLVGVLASILNPLAGAGVSVFAISTFDTDYVLLKASSLAVALPALESAGHTVITPDTSSP